MIKYNLLVFIYDKQNVFIIFIYIISKLRVKIDIKGQKNYMCNSDEFIFLFFINFC